MINAATQSSALTWLPGFLAAVLAAIIGAAVAIVVTKLNGDQQRKTEEFKARRVDSALREHTRVLCQLELEHIEIAYLQHAMNFDGWKNAHQRLEQRAMDPALFNAFPDDDELQKLLTAIESSQYMLTIVKGQLDTWAQHDISSKTDSDGVLSDDSLKAVQRAQVIAEWMVSPLKEYEVLFRDVFGDTEKANYLAHRRTERESYKQPSIQ